MVSRTLSLLVVVSCFAQQSSAACSDCWVLLNDNSAGHCNDNRPDPDRACAEACGESACDHECRGDECWCNYEEGQGYCAGDPHCRSLDNARFDFHGTCKHTLVKQCRKTSSFPTFTLSQTNRKWGTRVAVVDVVYLHVKEWKTTVEMFIGDTKLNGRSVSFPEVHVFKGSYPGFIEMKKVNNFVFVVTSFGLTIARAGYSAYYRFPKHPDLQGNTCGLLGNFDGNRNNDCIDADGTQHVCRSTAEWAVVGNSWCETSQGKQSKAQAAKMQADVDRELHACMKDTGRRRTAEKLCAPVKQIANSCRRIDDDDYNDCVFDVCFSHGNRKAEMACANVESANFLCRSSVPCES